MQTERERGERKSKTEKERYRDNRESDRADTDKIESHLPTDLEKGNGHPIRK
jgi:hypothetical protein